MVISAAAARIRPAMGRVGAILGLTGTPSDPPVGVQRDGVRRLEAAGYGAVSTNEVVGADALVRASLWLAATDAIVVGTSIANMWARPPQTAHAAATQISQAFGDRFVLGLGTGYPQQAAAVGRAFISPVATARAYLQPTDDLPYPRILGANGPLMLATAAELTDGVLPAGAPPAFTARARERFGPDGLVVVFVPSQPSDAVSSVVAAVDAHLDAGADHVIVGMSYTTDFAVAVDRLVQLAPSVAHHA